jgi:hypothetical protein
MVDCLVHIVNATICQDKQNIVYGDASHILSISLLSVLIKSLKNPTKEGRPGQSDGLQILPVGLENIVNSLDSWVSRITIKREAMRDGVVSHVSRNTTKTENWEISSMTVRF